MATTEPRPKLIAKTRIDESGKRVPIGSALTPTPVVPEAEATPATAYKNFTYGTNPDQNAERVQNQLLQNAEVLATGKIGSEEDVYKNKLKQYQSEIDATNSIYAQILADTQQQGLGRLGSGRAVQARGGLLGSDFASAQNDTIGRANLEGENLVRAEQATKIASIMGRARQSAIEEIAAKREAQKQGAEDYLSYLAGSQERKASKAKKLALSLLEQDLTTDQIDPNQLKKIAKDYGLSVDDISYAYREAKNERDTLQAEADAKARKDNSFELSEGQSYYQYDPATGTYTEVASKGKTYAPSSSNNGATPLAGAESAFVSQPAYARLGTKQKGQADSLNNLIRTINEYKTTYRDTVRPDGSQIFGDEAALLETKLNSIIFAAAQAEGTGALQQADREVIEKIFPNPTKLGALGTFAKGGKEGGIKKIEDQLMKYTNNLAGYGLVPVISPGMSPSVPARTLEDLQAEFPEATPEEIQALAQEEGLL